MKSGFAPETRPPGHAVGTFENCPIAGSRHAFGRNPEWAEHIPEWPQRQCTSKSRHPQPGQAGTMTLVLDYNIIPRAGDYSFKLCLLSLRYTELVKCLLQIVKKSFPFCRGNLQILVRVLH